ncbi:MAG: hypothetical protein NT167_05940 [Verrucomicrobia bacterium]|nr:hypothetical protein [Verrucomicrobiota bacterium]
MRIERTLFPPVPRRSQRGGWWVKSEIRNPKTEGNPKAEIRITPAFYRWERRVRAPGLQDGGDIPETVTQASGAASKAMELLAPARNSLITSLIRTARKPRIIYSLRIA